jgi:hypothetical protein
MKLDFINEFELFIYDLTSFSYDQAGLLARLFIGIELVLAFLFIYDQFYKQAVFIAGILTLGFSFFLFQHLDLKDCFCFGPNFPFSAKDSLWKNGLILLLISIYYLLQRKHKSISAWANVPKSASWLIISLLIIGPFLYNIPSVFARNLFVGNNFQKFEIKDAAYKKSIQSVLEQFNISPSDKALVPIVSGECKYCKASMGLLKSFDGKYPIKEKATILVIGDDSVTKRFMKETLNDEFKFHNLDVHQFMEISKGVIPQFLFIKNNKYYMLKSKDLRDEVFKEWLK